MICYTNRLLLFLHPFMNAYRKFSTCISKIHKGLIGLVIGGNEMIRKHVSGLRDMTKEEFLKILQNSVELNSLFRVLVTKEVGK